MPAGWQFAAATGQIAVRRDGGQQPLGLSVQYERAGYFPIKIARAEIGGQIVDLVNPALDTKHALTVSSIGDVPVVIEHQAPGAQIQAVMHVFFVQKGIYTVIEAPALDMDELLKIAARLIEAGK